MADASDPRPQPGPSDYAPTALPSTGARVLAFVSILLAGTCGGIIGYAFADLQCDGDCTVQRGLGATTGALIGAVGVAVVATLALRAMGEWRIIQHREEQDSTP
ncbi:MAG TPA: hypothetical protein VK611_24070 [Acidimicrobiales bacterium]|nr:hypothetical protein [Acidimicrobiales bacterium]